MPLETLPALQRIAVALLLGMLIGLDRERTELRGEKHLFAGVRTFPLIALAGAVPMVLYGVTGILLLLGTFLAVAAITVVSYARSSAAGDAGATTEIAALATFLLGVLAGTGQLILASATGVAVAVLLFSKPRLERFSRTVTPEELGAVLELAVLSVVVLPVLPRQGYGPWGALNPFEIWLVVVLVSALSFIGFVAVRVLGERRGMTATGFVGGLVSSLAVTLSMAERSRTSVTLARPAAAAVTLASTVMCARLVVLAGIVNVAILPRLVPVALAMAAAGALAARLLVRSRPGEPAAPVPRLSNPFSLRSAITFALLYALVKLVVRAAQEWMGSAGLFVAAMISGLADVDAPAIAFTRLGPLADGWRTLAAAVALAALANTGVKAGLAVGLGSGPFRRYVALALAGMGCAGLVTAALVYARP